MKKVTQNLKQVEKEEFESSQMCAEITEDVQVFQEEAGSSSSLVAVTTAGRVENGQGLNNPKVVVEPVFPVDTLLEEVGLQIFEMLSDEDVASCFRAYSKWQQWLLHQRTRFLFPEVVPLLLKYLPKTSLLECRKVCRSWKDGLDNAYQSHPQHLQVDSEDLILKDSIPRLINLFASADKIKSFLQAMESHPGNPFPGRYLVIKWNFPGIIDDYDAGYLYSLFHDYWKNSVIQLLDMFGQQVHFICLDIRKLEWFEANLPFGLDFNNWNFPQIVQSLLEHLPNLKKLEIYGDMGDGWAMNIEEERRRMRTRLPQLANLETVGMLIPDGLMASILESCCNPNNIKRVDLCPLDYAVFGFQNLEVMDVGISLEYLERFRTLERCPPLRKVVLDISYPDPNCVDWRRFIDFKRLCTILEVFADTLKDVQVTSGDDTSVGEVSTLNNERKGFRINLPKLERLSWKYYVGPLDPFIQLPSLRHLDFDFEKILPWEGTAVQLYGLEERMESSNIWTLIPSLKTLKISGRYNFGWRRKSYDRSMIKLNICKNGNDEEMDWSGNESSSEMDFA